MGEDENEMSFYLKCQYIFFPEIIGYCVSFISCLFMSFTIFFVLWVLTKMRNLLML